MSSRNAALFGLSIKQENNLNKNGEIKKSKETFFFILLFGYIIQKGLDKI